MLFHDLTHETVKVRYLDAKMHPVIFNNGGIAIAHQHMVLIQVAVAQVDGLSGAVISAAGTALLSFGGDFPYFRCFQGIIFKGWIIFLRPQPFDSLHGFLGLLVKHIVVSNDTQLKIGLFTLSPDIVAGTLHFLVMAL